VGRRSLVSVLGALVACGGSDPLLSFVVTNAGEGVDATVRRDAGCDACSDVLFTLDGIPPPPPPPQTPIPCPPLAPIAGGACNTPQDEDCEYGSSTSWYCNDHYRCITGQWVFEPGNCDPTEPCATITDGGTCQSPGQVCGDTSSGSMCLCVGGCGGGAHAKMPTTVEGGVNRGIWRCTTLTNGCTGARPRSGTTCDLPDGSVCTYGAGCCAGVSEECSEGVWLAYQSPPCP
jgi:hypothetical protein